MNHFFKVVLVCSVLMCMQSACTAQSDFSMLSLSDYFGIIKKYHPIARQADLLSEQARVNLRIARGGFDPYLYTDYARKEFYGKNYFSFFNSEFKIPAWFGIEVKTGYELAYGLNINPESNIPEKGIYYVGISLPLLKNMLMDKKRADLNKAKLFVKATQQERLLLLNDLLLDATEAYYQWCEAETIKDIYAYALNVSKQRYYATVRAFQLGDRAAIDTVEAFTQVQQRLFQFNDADLNVLKARLIVSNYLWQSDETPFIIPDSIKPVIPDSIYLYTLVNTPIEKLEKLLAFADFRHPAILQYSIKLKQLEVEKKWNKEGLKPTFNVNYNLLSPGFFDYKSYENRIFSNYYKLGFNFNMPLTFTQARGQLQQTRLKITETKLSLTQKQLELKNKVATVYAELLNLKEQILLYSSTLNNYKFLLKGENKRFDIGESTLFLVNTRENTAVLAEQKLIELQMKYLINEAKLKWTLAQLAQ